MYVLELGSAKRSFLGKGQKNGHHQISIWHPSNAIPSKCQRERGDVRVNDFENTYIINFDEDTL